MALAFHRVLNQSDYVQTHSQPEILLREHTFRELAAYVARNFETLDLHDAVPGTPSKRLRMVFTFDDGWWDNYEVVLPIAWAHKIPLTIFICPQTLGRTAPFWPERVVALLRALTPNIRTSEIKREIEQLKREAPQDREQKLARLAQETTRRGVPFELASIDRTISWQEITEMDRAGVKFGSHTHSHEILTCVPADTARQEIEGSGTMIERMLGKPCTAFSYPNGSWSPEVRRAVADAGFKLAVTGDRYIWTTGSDPLTIPRSNVYEDDVVGLDGRFSSAMFEYSTIWKPWLRSKLRPRMEASAPKPALATL